MTDVAVVGGGIVGLACARELQRRGARVVVHERRAAVGTEQTGRSSGVVHQGLYYAPGSLKARLCREGADRLKTFATDRGIAYRELGKLVIATTREELPRLDAIEERARANGVPDLARLDADGIRHVEPHAAGLAALHSPRTAVTDFPAIARALADEVVAAGGELRLSSPIGDPRHLHADRVLVCAGLGTDALAPVGGPHIVPFRGAYRDLTPDRAALVRGLLYPVPDPRLPFLGAHITRHHDDSVSIGPTALPWPSPRVLRRPGTWRLLRRFPRAAARELAHAIRPSLVVREAARMLPGLTLADTVPSWTGLRAQAVERDGTLVDDFALSRDGRVLHVRNAPSPAATASLALAEHLVEQL